MGEMKRYDVERSGTDGWRFSEEPQGDWVKFSDVEPLIEALKKIASGDFRGPRTESARIAYEVLRKAGIDA